MSFQMPASHFPRFVCKSSLQSAMLPIRTQPHSIGRMEESRTRPEVAKEGRRQQQSSSRFARVLLVVSTLVASSSSVFYLSKESYLTTGPELKRNATRHDAGEQDSRPTDLRLFMMGDSIMRYQYLSLAYFLRWGKWFDPHIEDHHLVNEKSFHDNWTEFYNTTNSWLRPYEICDCFRDDSLDKRSYPDTENHFFFDPSRNNTVIFVFAWGHINPAHGRLPIDQSTMESITNAEEYRHEHSNATPNVWSFVEWDEVINYTFSQLRGTNFSPTHVLLNSGLWMGSPRDFHEARRSKLAQTLRAMNVNATWRTTSLDQKGNKKRPARLNDPVMCAMLDQCLKISWWGTMRRDLYWNAIHPKEPLYRGANEDLLDLLGHSFPSHYRRLNRSEWASAS